MPVVCPIDLERSTLRSEVPDKARAFAEIARVLEPGGRAQIADIIIGEALSDSALRDIDLWTG